MTDPCPRPSMSTVLFHATITAVWVREQSAIVRCVVVSFWVSGIVYAVTLRRKLETRSRTLSAHSGGGKQRTGSRETGLYYMKF